MSSILNVISSILRQLIDMLEGAPTKGIDRDQALRLVDEVENQIDALVAQSAPERITDERFSTAVEMLKDLSDKLRRLREAIIAGRYLSAKRIAIDVQSSLRHIYRILILIKAGAPTPMILQVAPEFIREIRPPEQIIFTSPMAAQIYNILARRREATIEELARELGIDERTRDDFNRAVAQLISMGYATIVLTPDNRIMLKLVRW